jgi:hypothetical protein
MKGHAWFTVGLMGVLLVAAGPRTRAFVSYVNESGQPQKWNLLTPSTWVHTNVVNPATHALRYFLSAEAYSAANTMPELNAARACFDQWQAVPGTVVKFEEGGLLSGRLDVNTTDNTNLVYWTKQTTIVNGGLDNISGATGVTFSDFFPDGTLAEADIVLNGRDFTWFTDFTNTVNRGQFVESVLLHEIGHMMGLECLRSGHARPGDRPGNAGRGTGVGSSGDGGRRGWKRGRRHPHAGGRAVPDARAPPR